MGQLFAVEVIYRGVFQKTLAKNITRDIVLAAHNEGKLGISFGRYGDAPERNGIPAKSFAIVANDEQTLEAGMAQYEPKQVDLSEIHAKIFADAQRSVSRPIDDLGRDRPNGPIRHGYRLC